MKSPGAVAVPLTEAAERPTVKPVSGALSLEVVTCAVRVNVPMFSSTLGAAVLQLSSTGTWSLSVIVRVATLLPPRRWDGRSMPW